MYRLPTEAEWEYACRGGAGDKLDSAFDFYFSSPTNSLLPEQANFEFPTALKRSTKVGSYEPNMLGLHDMHGNVWEWCADEFESAELEGSNRVNRGGCWDGGAALCRSADRGWGAPVYRSSNRGFRVALVPVAHAEHRGGTGGR